MRIESIELFRVSLPGVVSESGSPLESVIVALRSGEAWGLGEATLPRGPLVCDEWSAGALLLLKDWIAPSILGRDIAAPSALQQLLQTFQGNARARGAVDVAWWNLMAVQQNKPLHRVLAEHAVAASPTTGEVSAVELTRALPVPTSAEQLLRDIDAALTAGFGMVTLKYRPGWEVEMVRAVRQAFPSAAIAIDCDGQCSLSQLEMFYRLDDFFLTSIEQPLPVDDLVGHAMLQQSIRTPIALDQSICSLGRVEQALDLGCCKQMRIDPARLGGLTAALAVRAACAEAGMPCAAGGPLQGAIGTLATHALAMLPNFTQPCEAFDLIDPPSWMHGNPLANWRTKNGQGHWILSPPAAEAEHQTAPDVDLQNLRAVALERVTIA